MVAPASALTSEQSRSRKLDILVVEDNEEMRRALELILGHLGNLCFSSSSLVEARSILDAFVIDLIICDLHLPDGDAFMLRKEHLGIDVPAILITADMDPFITRRSREAGYCACLRKPLELDELTEVIRRVAPPNVFG